VEVQIATDDLEFLKANQYMLCFAKMVDGAYTVVWQSYSGYLSGNPFNWTSAYQLFGSTSASTGGTEIIVSTNAVDIALGEQATLNPDGNLEPAVTGGPADGITMINQHGPIYPGLNGVSTGPDGILRTAPVFLAPLAIAKGTDVLRPVEKIRIWFQQNTLSGTAIDADIMSSQGASAAVEVDLTKVDGATVKYQQGGWSNP
jgi:hypothetical protein